jgi:hypothetical protein
MQWAIEGETRQVGREEEDSSGGEIFGIEEDGSRMGDEGKRTFSVSSQLVHLIYLIVA